MKILKSTSGATQSTANGSRSRRISRFNFTCESLEHRQLLSVDASPASLAGVTAAANLVVLPMASGGPSGYSPQQIATAYGISGISFSGGSTSGTGAGQTIAIVDAYSDPQIASDLAKFDSQYGLAAPPSFVVDNLGGSAANAGWALETSLDVEWAHAIAPKANIVLVEAASSNLGSLLNAVDVAKNLPGVSVVSMSWGTQEFWGEQNYNSVFTTPAGHTGVTFVAASGDDGAWYGPMFPSVSPNVVAVGGTTLTLGSNGSYLSETGWSGSTGGYSGTDMDFYSYEPAPSYQVPAQQASGISYGVRTTPDVAFNANPNTGVAVYDSVSYDGLSGWFDVGGTSAAAPAWASLIAIADQGLAAAGKSSLTSNQTLSELYALPSSDYHDITSGSNGYSATPGYDLVTGLGSPKANLVVSGLVSAGSTTATSTTMTTLSITTSSGSGTASQHSTHGATDVSSTATTISVQPSATTTSSVVQIGVAPAQTAQLSTSLSTASAAVQNSVSAPASQAASPSQGTLGQGLLPGSSATPLAVQAQTQETGLDDGLANAQTANGARTEAANPPAKPRAEALPGQGRIEQQEPAAAPAAPSPNRGDISGAGVDGVLDSVDLGRRPLNSEFAPAPLTDLSSAPQRKVAWKFPALFASVVAASGAVQHASNQSRRDRSRWLPERRLPS